ncbi:putative Cytochrome P450 monooxygenase [Seiridium cardinale]|uniref:Cytochrome P450 monooxygenase n=1 Tax=Seiridium cardinale TaxID=138064 RepID=A0ABR2XC17_9PEZI
MVKWFEMNAFDLLGEMAFGESFGCIAEEKHHVWIDLILIHLREIVLANILRRVRLLAILGNWVLSPLTTKVRAKHQNRLDSKSSQQVFFTNIVAKVKSSEFGSEEMTAHASTLMYVYLCSIADAETTALTLAATLYYMLRPPQVLSKLAKEIRSRCNSYDEIDSASALQLTYLQAAINEALRIRPAVDGHWVPAGSPGMRALGGSTANSQP